MGTTPGEPIARGRTAEIYALDTGRVLKQLLPRFDRAALSLEAELTAAAHAAGAPAPAVLGSLEMDGRPGAVFERIPGRSIARLLPAHASGLSEGLVHRRRLPVPAGRLSEGIEHEERPLVAEIRRLVA